MMRIMIKAMEELEKLGFIVNNDDIKHQILDAVDAAIAEYINDGIERFVSTTKSIKEDSNKIIDDHSELIFEVNREELYKNIRDRLKVRSGAYRLLNEISEFEMDRMVQNVALLNHISVIQTTNGILRFTLNFKTFANLTIKEEDYDNFIDKLGDAIKECVNGLSYIDNELNIICKKKDLCDYLDLPGNSRFVDLGNITKACEKKGAKVISVETMVKGEERDIEFSIRTYK